MLSRNPICKDCQYCDGRDSCKCITCKRGSHFEKIERKGNNMNTLMPKTREIKPPEAKIVITSMLELPEYCYNCPCHDGENDKCRADTEGRTSIYRPFWCPLREEKDRTTVYRGD